MEGRLRLQCGIGSWLHAAQKISLGMAMKKRGIGDNLLTEPTTQGGHCTNAFCLVSDSGTLPEKSSFFASIGRPFPAVCIRTSTERPEALDKACFTLAGIDERGLLNAVRTAVALDAEGSYSAAPVPDYADENVSTKVVKIIQSYTGIVDRMVWRKY